MAPRLVNRALWLLVAAATVASAGAAELDTNGVPVPTRVSAKATFHDTSLIADLAGRWAGAGSARYTDGSSEQLRCVATYIPDATVLQLRQTIRCHGANMVLQLGGSWAIKDGAIEGTWSEDTYSLSGRLSGHSTPAGFDFKATSTFADASVAVRLSGCTQDVVMTFSQEVDNLHVALRKC